MIPNLATMSTHTTLLPILLFVVSTSTGWCQSMIEQVAADPGVVVYPYNPDEDNSGTIGIGDLLPFLIYFNNPVEFIVQNTEQDEYALQNVLGTLAQTVVQQAATIDSLESALATHMQAMEAYAPLLNLLPLANHGSYYAPSQTYRLDGINLQLTNGSGVSYGVHNGTGNLILGYNEIEGGYHLPNGDLAAGEVRTGSHNVILGSGHSYTHNGGILGGTNNTLSGKGATVLGGQSSLASGNFASVLGGLDNRAMGGLSCISGGHSNIASGDRSSVSGGLLNVSAGIATSVLGGQYMQIFEQYETASGQYDVNN